MFKGLRTKIESEQNVQGSTNRTSGLKKDIKDTKPNSTTEIDKSSINIPIKNSIDSKISVEQNQSSLIKYTKEIPDRIEKLAHQTSGNESAALKPLAGLNNPTHDAANTNYQEQVLQLSDQLKSVMKERDEGNEQNAQLYQLIEKLRRNLENEKETNSSLRLILGEFEAKLKNETDKQNQNLQKSGNRVTNISIKPFNHNNIPSGTNDLVSTSNDTNALQNELMELKADLAKKNRLLKIKQQNLNDLKRTLQKEMYDHGECQTELAKLQTKLRDQEALVNTKSADLSQAAVASATVMRQNGSTGSDLHDAIEQKRSNLHHQNNNDKNHIAAEHSTLPTLSNIAANYEDNLSLSAASGSGIQIDRISCLSRSSAASVDDFDVSNDIQQSSHNKEVNHEYLKNVLFRYMTSTDTETTRHLIKALSVLMDFNSDQAAAIKNAMDARSSWLRLK